MTALHLIRMPLSLPDLNRWAGERGIGWTARRNREGAERSAGFDEGRALHHLLSESFGKGVLQPFRLFAAPGAKRASLYAYTTREKAELEDIYAACALPETRSLIDLSRMETKSMPEVWRAGRRLGFETRVRPVRRLLRPCGPFPKGAEIDAFLVHAMRQFPDGPASDPASRLKREDAYRLWLAERLAGVAELVGARLTRFLRHRASRHGAVEGPDATLQGDLVIRDPVLFADRLARGLGRHSAYGFGMLLLRPPGRS